MAKLKFKKIQKNDIPPVNALNDVTSGEEAKATMIHLNKKITL